MLIAGILLAALPEWLLADLEYNRSLLATGEAWRLWTGHFVHFSVRHAFVDLAAMFVFCNFIERHCGIRMLAWLLLSVPLLLSMALFCLVTPLDVYRGASGLCVAMGVVAGFQLWRKASVARPALFVLAAAFTVKTFYEAAGDAMNVSALPDDIHVVWQAHVVGAILGICACWLEGTSKNAVSVRSTPYPAPPSAAQCDRGCR
jgi:rhomboid family GlyGly-CTERM serine protease